MPPTAQPGKLAPARSDLLAAPVQGVSFTLTLHYKQADTQWTQYPLPLARATDRSLPR